MIEALHQQEKALAVIGQGYVGLPLSLAFATHFRVIAYDIDRNRIENLQQSVDSSRQMEISDFEGKNITFTSREEDLQQASFFVVAVPTPVDEHRVPDLSYLLSASKAVGKALKKGDYVVYESTVYPGCTEEDCVPVLEKHSGLSFRKDFKVGYSPERINPGDKKRTLETILKIVSGCDPESLMTIAEVYQVIIKAGIYQAPGIRVAEAAKVVENVQRDLNISLMNELSIIFDKMKLDTGEVLKAAATKWNFMRFSPGLVGGHCVGIDPYYLIHKSKQLGYDPQVIHAGRRINDEMPLFIARKLVRMLIKQGKSPQHTKVLVMGITFKENVADIRNTKVVDLIHELQGYSVLVDVVDPYADAAEVRNEYQLTLSPTPNKDYDAIVVAVSHEDYVNLPMQYFLSLMNDKPILMDVKGMYQKPEDSSLVYWRL